MGSQMAGAPALDAYLHQSFDLIQYVADNMAAIKAVADHLTPVEDLVDFKATIDELYGKLDLLVEASELIIQTTPAGIQLILAPDAATQRLVLGLGSASVKDASYFAKAIDLATLTSYVDEIKLITDQLLLDLQARVTHDELAAVTLGIQGQLDDLTASTAINDRINEIVAGLSKGDYTDAVNSKITALTTRVEDSENNLIGQATVLGQLVSDVLVTEQGIDTVAADLVSLYTEVSDAQAQLAGDAAALGNLTTRTSTLEGVVISQAEDLTQLAAQADNLAAGLSSQGDAVQSLEVLASNTDGAQQTTAAEVTQLAGRISNAEDEITIGVSATQGLATDLAATQAGLVATGEDVTDLQASITGTGNLLPNAAFEMDTHAWTLFSHGAGWLAADLELNLDPELLPQALNVLSLKANGVPSGNAGIRSSKLPISAQTGYILSGYMAAENCTFRMEWRLFDASGNQVGMDVVGSVTNIPPANNLVNWERVHNIVHTPVDAALLEVQLWVTACNTAPPKVWFLRPQMEEAVGTQTMPSPWVPGINGLEETLANATNALTIRVESTEAGLLSAANSLTNLESRIGNVVTWRVVTIAGSGDAASVGAPLEPSIRVASKAVADYAFLRGLTLVRFGANGELESTTRFDTYASATERVNLTAALDALGPNDGFLLVSENNHGIKDETLTAAMERCGALEFVNITGSNPYALRGRGGIGKGGGIENYPLSENQFIDFTFTTANDMPQGLGEQGVLSGVATAVQGLSTEVSDISGEMAVVTASNTELNARTDGAESALVDALIIRATKDAVLISQTNLMDSRLTVAEVGMDAAATTVAGYDTRLTNAEGTITSQTTEIDAIHNSISSLDGELGVTNGNLSTLTSTVTAQGEDLTAQGVSLTSMISQLTGPDGAITANTTSIEGITTSVSLIDGVVSAQGQSISQLSSDVDGAMAAVSDEASTRATAISAVASDISDVSTTMDGHTSSISFLQQSTDGLEAQAALVLSVDGKVSGIKASASSGESNITFDFDNISFISSSGQFTLTAGLQVSRAGGFMTVMGAPFGVGSLFLQWFGPDISISQCDTDNAISYQTKTGVTFARAFVGDSINFSGGSDSKASNAIATCSVPDTVGNSKKITYAYGFSTQDYLQTDQYHPDPPAMPADRSATLQLWRSIGSGGYTLLATKTLTLDGYVDNRSPDTAYPSYFYGVRGSGSWSYTDTTTSLSDLTYQLRLVSRTSTGNVNDQALSVQSMESST